MDRRKTCAFTGNRPQKLPWGEDETDYRCVAVKNRIREELIAAIERGYDTFISGMALGGDTYFAEEVLALKKTHGIKLICAVPFPDQSKGWSASDVDRYYGILAQADETVTLSEHYSKYCMHKRNRYMVDNSSLLLCLDYADDGGTTSTVAYAVRQNLIIVSVR
ncbi:MAG: DUF1273 family protein [Clostridia bacterium]|nr:DUF1273 family protein [Clostridia bacterium]